MSNKHIGSSLNDLHFLGNVHPAHDALCAQLTVQANQAPVVDNTSIADQLAMPGAAETEFDPPRQRTLHRPADLG